MKKIVLHVMLLCGVLLAQESPKIALVLSGGGARGGAHVGVLKILEELHIPVHIIVGTSMGSFVGGLYASGKTPQEIEDILVETNWYDAIRVDFDREDIPMRRKDIDYMYQGKLSLGVNEKNQLVVPTGVFNRETLLLKFTELTNDVRDIDDFDKLSIPYRAVATDISNGDKVVLKSGSLAEAIYASSSIPGGLQPIRIGGKVLVDGGVSDNIPIDVAKEMGADIIIAVDVSENFAQELDVNSYFVVMGQLINILMRKNANESLKMLTDKDVLITPELDGYTGIDADKYDEIIQIGEKTARKKISQLRALGMDAKSYEQYRQKYRVKHRYDAPVIDEIRIINNTYLADEIIRSKIHQQTGQKADLAQLNKDMLSLYNMTIFDSITYDIKEVDGKNILYVIATPSWNSKGEMRFSIGFEDDFKGHSAYSFKMGYTMFGLNSYGGEIRADFEIGREKLAHLEWFQPLDAHQRFYIKPSVVAKERLDVIPLDLLTGNILNGNKDMQNSRIGYGIDFGMQLERIYEFEVGMGHYTDTVDVEFDTNVYSDNGVIVPLNDIDARYKALPLHVKLRVDSLDNVNFPQKGVRAEFVWLKEFYGSLSDYDYEQIYTSVEKPINFYNNNINLYFKYGNTYKVGANDATHRVQGTFSLGGLFNLSGYAPYSFNDDNVILGVLKYTYKLKDSGFFGSLNAPLYAGFSLEAGDVWDAKEKHISVDTMRYSSSVYVAADTFLGPFYLAYGISDDQERRAYLYLGEKF